MSTSQNIPADTGVKELLSDLMPVIAKEQLAQGNAKADLAGTEISMVIEVDGANYGYRVKDGADIEFISDNHIDNPMLRLQVSESDLQKMIQTNNLDIILGMQNDLNRAKYNAISSLKGSFIAEIANDDGSTFKINAILNGAESPSSVFKMTAADTGALMRKETNPVNLFMSGAMKIEGDMAFAMATQPLFT